MSGRVRLVAGTLAEQDADALVVAVDERGRPLDPSGQEVVRAVGMDLAVPLAPASGLAPGAVAVLGAPLPGAKRVLVGVRLEAGEPTGAEESVRAALAAALAAAAERGSSRVAVPPLGAGAGGLGMQRAAELLVETAHDALARHEALAEVCFVLPDEPSFRLFEAVEDARRIAAQMARLGLT